MRSFGYAKVLFLAQLTEGVEMNHVIFKLLILFLILIIINGCATMNTIWMNTERENTQESYKAFVEQYPDCELAKEAKKRIDDVDYAFFTTCQLGTIESFRGFATSHPSSYYIPIVNSRIEFLSETNPYNINSYKLFIENHPHNPFILEAKASIPVLWLHEQNKTIGIAITIDSIFSWRGIFSTKKTKDELKNILFNELNDKYFKNEGIHTFLINYTDTSNSWLGNSANISTIIELNYSERGKDLHPYNSYSSGSSGFVGYTSDALHNTNVNMIANSVDALLGTDIKKIYSFTVRDAMTGFVYCLDISSLSQSVSALEMLQFLDYLSTDKRILPSLLIASCSYNTEVRWRAIFSLAHFINQNVDDGEVKILRNGIEAIVSEALLAAAKKDKNKDADFRASVAMSVANMKNVNLIKSLTSSLENTDPIIRTAAVKAIGMIGDSTSNSLLIKAFTDEHWAVRTAAVEQFGIKEDSLSKELLFTALNDKCWAVRTAARKALEQKIEDIIIMETTIGTIEIELFESDAPKTVTNFACLSEQGYYNGGIFYNIDRGLGYIFGCDSAGTETGGRSIYGKEFEDELNPKSSFFKTGYIKGTVAMGNHGPNTNTSHIMIFFNNSPILAKNYTIFGKVVSGMDVIEEIANSETIQWRISYRKPKTDVKIIRAYLKY
ncbi:MAG: peptidylprolyl isomerase [bacterium]